MYQDTSGYSVERHLGEMARGLFIIAIISFFLICIWNILNFFIFQWFGFRYYGLGLKTIINVFIGFIATAGPIIVGNANHAPALGIAISCFTIPITLIVMRMEASVWRQEN